MVDVVTIQEITNSFLRKLYSIRDIDQMKLTTCMDTYVNVCLFWGLQVNVLLFFVVFVVFCFCCFVVVVVVVVCFCFAIALV